jgi:hypothetical protein
LAFFLGAALDSALDFPFAGAAFFLVAFLVLKMVSQFSAYF